MPYRSTFPFGSRARAGLRFLLGAMLAVPSCAEIPPLPDPSGWGTHVLAADQAPDGTIWVGTYGDGVYALRPGASSWESMRSDTTDTSISWDFVHAFAFQEDGTVWYGTLGNGWGRSTDGGATWSNWTFRMLGPEYQYVAPRGIVVRGDTVYVATADGVKVTWDDGATWRVVTDSMGAASARDSVLGTIGNQYVLAIARGPNDALWLSHVHGVERSTDGGRTWKRVDFPGADTLPKVRGFEIRPDESVVARGDVPVCVDAVATVCAHGGRMVPDDAGEASAALPEEPRHTWFRRPVDFVDQPYVDQTYRYGSTMGGNFQQHQGIEFNGGEGTLVRAIGSGTVALAGEAEAGALTVAIRHDRALEVGDDRHVVFSVYYHNTTLLVREGQRVSAGDEIARIGNTGRATNDHLHLELHAAPWDAVRLVVDPDERYPPYTTNPELWIEPLPGTGIVAGQVWDADGAAVGRARIYGLRKAQPQETPFSFVETYGDQTRGTPAYDEHFAIGDVPPGTYMLGVEVDDRRILRTVTVEAGKLTWVEFRP